MKTPIVTIVGKPNVGKSTLFNRIAGSRIAITSEVAGTTRDRIFYKVENPEIDFFLVDTGGLDFGKGENTIENDMRLQAQVAIEEADLIIFLVDSKTPLNTDDFNAADLLRKKSGKKPIFLVANKCDDFLPEAALAELYSLGLGDPEQISALHKMGFERLMDKIIKKLKDMHFVTKSDPQYKRDSDLNERHRNIAMVGRPNVGKSSLINALLNKEKLIVSPIPGTTRDSTDSLVKREGKEYNFIDTAGLKRPGHTKLGIEKFSALRSMASIDRADIALLVLDTSEDLGHQDQQIANFILRAGKGLVILANKWDIRILDYFENDDDEDEEGDDDKPVKARKSAKHTTVETRRSASQDEEDEENRKTEQKKAQKTEEDRREAYINKLRRKFQFVPWAPVIFTSAVTKKNLHYIFEQVDLILEERQKRITTAQLNRFVEQAMEDHAPTGATQSRPKIYYITQVDTNPPHFIVFVNKKSAFHFSYLRYLENRLREKFEFTGTPIRIEYKEKPRRDR